DVSGALCISQAWPRMPRTIYNDHKRFLETYLTSYAGKENMWQDTCTHLDFFTGDGVYCTSEGYYQLTGWLDNIISISGHWLGTAEVENVVNHHVAVAESAVIGYPHEIKGEGKMLSFLPRNITRGYSTATLAAKLQELISKKIAKYAAPDYVQVTQANWSNTHTG
ncbi:ACS2L synthetase, partial [Vidua chalybeata]|nr:ACS2L synthetase [Vidua chalybeata]